MRRVVVYNQMQVQVRWGLLINQVEKFDPLLMPMAAHARCHNVLLGHLQRGKKGGRPMAFVVVGHGYLSSSDKRQSRLAKDKFH